MEDNFYISVRNIFKKKGLGHLDILQNITLVQHIDSVVLLDSEEQELESTLDALVT